MGSLLRGFCDCLTNMATSTEPLGDMNSATAPSSAAMDSQAFKDSLRKAFAEYHLSEVKDLLERNGHQFEAEANLVLVECVRDEAVPFGWIAQLAGFDSIAHVLPELIATAFAGKYWRFVKEAMLSTKGYIVIRYVKENKPDLHELALYWDDTGCVALSKLFDLLTEAGLYDMLKEAVVYWWEFDDFILPYPTNFFIQLLQQLVNVSRKNLWKAFKCFRKDCRESCQYAATFLALHLKKWKLAATILKTGAVKYMTGPNGALESALTDKAWECSVLMLYSMMCVENFCHKEVSKLGFQYCQHWKSHPDFVKPFVKMSKKLNVHAVGALVACWLDMWEVVKDLLSDLHKARDYKANTSLLVCVLWTCKFDLVYNWLQEPAQSSLQPSVVCSLLMEASDSCERHHSAIARRLTELLMGRCLDGCELDTFFLCLCNPLRSHCLLRFMDEGLVKHCDTDNVEQALLTLIRYVIVWKDMECFEQAHDTFLLCIEAGLECPLEDPFPELLQEWHQCSVNLWLICLLYERGIMSTQYAGLLLQGFKDRQVQAVEGEEAAVLSYLERVTDTPRTLTNACCIYVSRVLGYGAGRKRHALTLGLPTPLLHKVLFQQAHSTHSCSG